MTKIKNKIQILKQLEPSFKKNTFTDLNLDNILKKEKIEATKFYTLFPNKTKSLCCFFFENIENHAKNNIKKKMRDEKSISKRVKYLLTEFFNLLNKEKNTSIFFLSFLLTKPFLLKKISLNYSNKIWFLLEDKSVDFNFYTKRFILSQILINTLIYWRGAESIEKTKDFISNQIVALGKFGYYKSRFNKTITSLYKSELLTKFDFLHKN
ncbi:hypothetical protein N9R86_01050 [Alphaproteobacteria bacterium]|nr:hypothetical protein [Alphaproteobacteria bacterium]